MKVVCSNCRNSWELDQKDMPAGTADFETACSKCGSKVNVSRGGAAGASQAQWFVAFGRDRKGPFDEAAVKKMIVDGEIAPTGFVWKQGFDNWKKAAEVAEFASTFPQAGSQADAGMVWQRRETSVLFSLDDYKQRKATRSQGAVKDADVVDVRPIEDEKAPARSAGPSAGAGMISFDEAEVQRVADALARKKKSRRNVMVLVIVGGVLLLVAAAGLVTFKYISDKQFQMAVVPPPVAVQAPAASGAQAPAAQAPEPKVDAPAPAPVPEGEPKAVAVEKTPEPADDGAQPATDDQKAAQKGRKPKVERTQEAPPPRAEKVAEKAPEKAPEKPAEKAKPAQVGAGNDANALLAQLHSGRNEETGKKKDQASSESGSGLPDRLTVSQVSRGFNAKKGAMEACVKDAGEPLPFKAQAKVEIDGSGRVVTAKLVGGGNARGCLEGVLRSATFDKFGGDNMKVPYTVSVK